MREHKSFTLKLGTTVVKDEGKTPMHKIVELLPIEEVDSEDSDDSKIKFRNKGRIPSQEQ